MAFLGRITKFLLVLAVLPWGAYSVAGTSPSVVWVDMISVAQLVDLTDRADVGSRDPDLAIVAPVKKRCRTAALFGSPCGPDVTLSATKVVFGNPTSRQAVFRDPGRATLPDPADHRGRVKSTVIHDFQQLRTRFMNTRRAFMAAGSAATLSACAMTPQAIEPTIPAPAPAIFPPLPAHYGAVTGEPYPISAVPEGVVPPALWRKDVDNPFLEEEPGTIVVDPDAGFLHLIGENGRAMRYGAGTARYNRACAPVLDAARPLFCLLKGQFRVEINRPGPCADQYSSDPFERAGRIQLTGVSRGFHFVSRPGRVQARVRLLAPPAQHRARGEHRQGDQPESCIGGARDLGRDPQTERANGYCQVVDRPR